MSGNPIQRVPLLRRAPLLPLCGLLALVVFVGLMTGPHSFDWRSPHLGHQTVLANLGHLIFGGDGPMTLVMREIRLPRVLLGVMVGASLGMAGAAMQGYFRNPLAGPGLLGVSSSAALGAVLSLQLGLASTLPSFPGMAMLQQFSAELGFAYGRVLMLPLAALLAALLSTSLILLLAGRRASSHSLILAGIAIASFAGALTSLVINLSPNPYFASEMVFWMLGSLANTSFLHIAMALPLMLIGWLLLLGCGQGIDALTLGEDSAASLGISLPGLRLRLVLGTAAVVGAATAVAGVIGFVGLVVPHMLRALIGPTPSRLMLASAIGGAAMVVAADIVCQVILPDRDLKLGVATAIIGAPLFLHLIITTARRNAAGGEG